MSDFPQHATEREFTFPRVKLTKRNIEMVASLIGCDYKVTVLQNNVGLWTINVQFDDSTRQIVIETARGDVKVWRNVESAILFVKCNFNVAKEVVVEIGTWTLQRVGAARPAEAG